MSQPEYPYADGDTLVLGPQIFATHGGEVICWKGENYTAQTTPEDDTEEPDRNPRSHSPTTLRLLADLIEALSKPRNASRFLAPPRINLTDPGGVTIGYLHWNSSNSTYVFLPG